MHLANDTLVFVNYFFYFNLFMVIMVIMAMYLFLWGLIMDFNVSAAWKWNILLFLLIFMFRLLKQ